MQNTIFSLLFAFFLLTFIGLCIKLFGGSIGVFSIGAICSIIFFILLIIILIFRVLKDASFKFRTLFLAYLFAVITIIIGLIYRIYEGATFQYGEVGFKMFFLGLGFLIALLIFQFLYIAFNWKEDKS